MDKTEALRLKFKTAIVNRVYYIHDSGEDWETRHIRYAKWEAGMSRKSAWPRDPVAWRERLKKVLRRMPGRPALMFVHGYVLKGGFLDGRPGFLMARDRARYYALIRRLFFSDQ